MATAKKNTATDSATPKARKPREPKVVNDLPSAVVALNAAKRREERAGKAYNASIKEYDAAQEALETAKATVKRFYAETVGLSVEEDVNDPSTDAYDAAMESDGNETTEADRAV
jgi:hypothetical protein